MKSSVKVFAAFLVDIVSVFIFVVIGRSSHGYGESVMGILSTALPFQIGTLVGWIAIRAWRQPNESFPAGVSIWVSTVVVGQILRLIVGQGSTIIFFFVSLAFLGVPLLGWRLIVTIFERRVSAYRGADTR